MTPPPLLPATYYLDHFRQVVREVGERYGFLLDAAETAQLATLGALPQPAACLYARLVNRRGPCFRVDKLVYPEIADLPLALAQLGDAGLIESCACGGEGEGRARLLGCFTHAELAAGLRGKAPRRFARKEELLTWLDGWEEGEAWLAAHLAAHPVVRLKSDDAWPFFRFLFFGELRDNLSDFVTRELGHLVGEQVAAEALAPLFAARQEARDQFRMSCLYEEFRAVRRAQTAVATLAWWRDKGITRDRLSARARPLYDRLADRLGKLLEREGETAEAMALYATSPAAPARERLVRLLLKAAQREEALALCRAMLNDPSHAEEAYTAAGLLARIEKTAKRTPARHYHKESPLLLLPYEEGQVEAAVLAHYRTQGWQGVHAENWLWNALFGLLLWDIVYDPVHGGFHQPLQLAPADLNEPGFYTRRQAVLEARFAALVERETSLRLAREHHDAKAGTANPFVYWHPDLPEMMEILLTRLPGEAIGPVLRRMAQDYRRRSRGFPDLFLWRGEAYRFIEVKSENDHLSPHQYQWLAFLAEVGIEVGLERIVRPQMA